MSSREVRKSLVDALRLDLVGPQGAGPLAEEVLGQAPSRFYLTGFLVPHEAPSSHRQADEGNEELAEVGERGNDDDEQQEAGARAKAYFPSSMGLSVLVKASTKVLNATVEWGDYVLLDKPNANDETPTDRARTERWKRTPHTAVVPIDLAKAARKGRLGVDVPEGRNLQLSVAVRVIGGKHEDHLGKGTLAVSVFLVNNRDPSPDVQKDEANAFQASLLLETEDGFCPRPNLRGIGTEDNDERMLDLQYRDTSEFAVGHNVAAASSVEGKVCKAVRTTWIPEYEVEKVVHGKVDGMDLRMEALSTCATAAEVRGKLAPMVSAYAAWLQDQAKTQVSGKQRQETLQMLLNNAEYARDRIEDGLSALDDAKVLTAFRLANAAMASQAKQRNAFSPEAPQGEPTWRLFQIAFLVMNLRGLRQPEHASRHVVDLIFFPTGGGKTEAYLGLAAYTMVLRRLTHPGLHSAGVTVLMRYTLRLLTLDQLGRAATLVCALELIRQKNAETLGPWPFEIGLWVGRATTPNRMGKKGDNDEHSARTKANRHRQDSKKHPAPIPLENCPWCNAEFGSDSFTLEPDADRPTSLKVVCLNRRCAFMGDNALPIVSVDESIYRRLPALLIATVDKFAALPWTGQTGALFGKVDRADKEGFYGPCDPGIGKPLGGQLPPPDLIIQDELHLISGPLGTMAGLYETAIEALCQRHDGGKVILPKIVASTATVRQAQAQIQALFARSQVHVFPPQGPDLRDSFFALTVPCTEKNGRLYVGVSAQGRSSKVTLLRTYLAMLAAGERAWKAEGGEKNPRNHADPYMTLLGYFNSLRELGGSRRIIEDEVRTRLHGYANRKRLNEGDKGVFASRTIGNDVLELTSRETTDKVSLTKKRLSLPFREKQHVDVAIATNMISVGLDISRLGLMVVLGQPKSTAEYIQATSRVGRDDARPGLVLTLFNAYRPRDRSHYERFESYHQTFYRGVEATSVTPFSPRAIERALVAVVVSLARLGVTGMTPPRSAVNADTSRPLLDFIGDTVADRALQHAHLEGEEAEALRKKLKARVADLLDAWAKLCADQKAAPAGLQYAHREAGEDPPLLHMPLDPELATLDPRWKQFVAQRSLRDVEASVNLWVQTLDEAAAASEGDA